MMYCMQNKFFIDFFEDVEVTGQRLGNVRQLIILKKIKVFIF